MQKIMALSFIIAAMALAPISTTFADKWKQENAGKVRGIVTSDTLLSGMITSLMPPNRYSIEAMLPPVLCPGHYDIKLSDIEKMKKADLTVSFRGMAFMNKAGAADGAQFIVVDGGRNWMAPDSYIYGLGVLADRLSKHFPEDADTIMSRKQSLIREVQAGANSLIERIKQAGVFGKPIIASSMQKEPLEWMGFSVVGEYGRPEAMSAREFVRLARIGKDRHAIMVVDNLQSGPETGKGIAETLGTPHVVLMNYPSEKGYLATLGDNVDAVLAALNSK